MNRIGIVLGIFLFLTNTALAQQPSIPEGGVVNAASYAIAGLPNSGLARGGMFIVFGSNLGPATLARASSFPLPTNLSGTSIKVTVSGTTTDAIILYTSSGQVAGVMRSNTPTGTGTLTLTHNGSTSAPVSVQVVQASFGAFTLNQAGSGAAVILDGNNQPINALHPAAPGQTVALWGTGLGPVSGDETQAPPAGDLATPVEVIVGSTAATVVYKGRAPCCVSIDQINFVVPSGLSGCSIPVAVKINNVVSNFATIAVSNGGPCSDPNGLSSESLQRLQSQGNLRIGTVFLNRTSTPTFNLDGSTTQQVFEGAGGSFTRVDQQALLQSQGSFSQVSIGGCTVYSYSGQSSAAPSFSTFTGLNAGNPLTVTGPNGAKPISATSGIAGSYSASFNIPPAPANYITAGSYTFSGPGGSDVGPFSASINIGTPVSWTQNITTISRSQNLVLTWSGGTSGGYVVIGGYSSTLNADNTPGNSAAFYCLAPAGPGQFTVPSAVLLSLPQSSSVGAPPFVVTTGALYLGSYVYNSFTASGLDQGFVGYSENVIRFVNYQ